MTSNIFFTFDSPDHQKYSLIADFSVRPDSLPKTFHLVSGQWVKIQENWALKKKHSARNTVLLTKKSKKVRINFWTYSEVCSLVNSDGFHLHKINKKLFSFCFMDSYLISKRLKSTLLGIYGIQKNYADFASAFFSIFYSHFQPNCWLFTSKRIYMQL